MFSEQQKKIVNVVGGFLGAGKTTLANHILGHMPEQKVDIIVREYGAVSIDDRLIEGAKPHKIHVFPGIALHEDPQVLLYTFLCRILEDTKEDPFDHVLMETSGLDYPDSVVQLFLLGDVNRFYRLGSYIVVVDAQYGMLNLDEYDVAVEQIAAADAIVINKTDLTAPQDIDALERRVRAINSMAFVCRATHGRVAPDQIMNITLYDQLRNLTQTEERDFMKGLDAITTITLSETRPLDKVKTNAWLDGLFKEKGKKILRSKGFFYFHNDDYRYEFQAVRESFHSKADQLWQPEEEKKTTVVLIGDRNVLNDPSIKDGFRSCIF